MGDLESCKLSEVPWAGSGQEKYHFDNPQVCMIFNSGELTLIEYGRNEILGSCRTEHMSPHLISVRLSESKDQSVADVKKVAYLLDLQTIRITDLVTGITEVAAAGGPAVRAPRVGGAVRGAGRTRQGSARSRHRT